MGVVCWGHHSLSLERVWRVPNLVKAKVVEDLLPVGVCPSPLIIHIWPHQMVAAAWTSIDYGHGTDWETSDVIETIRFIILNKHGQLCSLKAKLCKEWKPTLMYPTFGVGPSASASHWPTADLLITIAAAAAVFISFRDGKPREIVYNVL